MVWTVALALAFSGAVGNLIDRVIHAEGLLDGKVVDFLDYGWSVGNVADVYLVVAGIGIALLIIANVPLTDQRRALRHARYVTSEHADGDGDGGPTGR